MPKNRMHSPRSNKHQKGTTANFLHNITCHALTPSEKLERNSEVRAGRQANNAGVRKECVKKAPHKPIGERD